MSAHVVLEGHPTLEEAQVAGERVKLRLARQFSIGHATLELECEPCATHQDDCLPGPLPVRSHRGHHDHS